MPLFHLVGEKRVRKGKALQERGIFVTSEVQMFRPSSVESGESGPVVDPSSLPRLGRGQSGGVVRDWALAALCTGRIFCSYPPLAKFQGRDGFVGFQVRSL